MLRRFGCAFRVLRERGRRKGPGGCEDCAAEQNMARSLFYFRHVSLPHDYHFSAGVDPAFFVSKVSCFVSWRGKSLGCGAAPGQRILSGVDSEVATSAQGDRKSTRRNPRNECATRIPS